MESNERPATRPLLAALLGAAWCILSHYCMCGHIAHGEGIARSIDVFGDGLTVGLLWIGAARVVRHRPTGHRRWTSRLLFALAFLATLPLHLMVLGIALERLTS